MSVMFGIYCEVGSDKSLSKWLSCCHFLNIDSQETITNIIVRHRFFVSFAYVLE